jgi:hypothetical protein
VDTPACPSTIRKDGAAPPRPGGAAPGTCSPGPSAARTYHGAAHPPF